MDFQTISIVKILLHRHIYSDSSKCGLLGDMINGKFALKDILFYTNYPSIFLRFDNIEDMNMFDIEFKSILNNFILQNKDALIVALAETTACPHDILVQLVDQGNSLMLFNKTIIGEREMIIYL